MNTYFKNLTLGSPIYALVKGEHLIYLEGTVTAIGQPRFEVAQNQFPATRTVIDLTYSINGKTYTEAVGETDSMFQSSQFDGITLVTADSDAILRELRSTLKKSEEYLKSTETEIPKQTLRVEECNKLISDLDKDYADKKAMDDRIQKLEEGTKEINSLLKEILSKMDKK